MSKGRSRSLTGVHAAIAAIAITAGLGAVGAAAAGNAAEHTLTAGLNSGPWSPSNNITIQTGDSVKWTFLPGSFHNVETDRRPGHPGVDWSLPGDDPQIDPVPNHLDVTHAFTEKGVYAFICEAHLGSMDGTITVQDEPVDPTPDPDPDPPPAATPTPTPTPTPQPSGGGHVETPAPTGGGDTVKPTVRNVSLTVKGRAVRVRFRLSERATVTVRIKRRSRVLKAASVQAAAGTRTVTLRSNRLTKGRYTVEIRARDAYGNRSSLATKRLLVRR
jgi:plastocyanin